MKVKTVISILLFFIFIATLSSCNPKQVLEPTHTTSPIITVTVIPTQTDIPTPEPTVIPEATSTPSFLQGQLSGLAMVPDVTVDAAGLHIILPDSSRVVDIATGDIKKQVIFDPEYSLYKIYDADGNISAEYDPGQGKEGDKNHVSSFGWVDIQELFKKPKCTDSGNGSCMSKSDIPNSVYFESVPSGVFRYKEVNDKMTGNYLGTILLMQMVSRDPNDVPFYAWMLSQSEIPSKPDQNSDTGIATTWSSGIYNKNDTKLVSIDTWREWIKNKRITMSLSKKGKSYIDNLKRVSGPEDYTVDSFIQTGGYSATTQNIILLPNGFTY